MEETHVGLEEFNQKFENNADNEHSNEDIEYVSLASIVLADDKSVFESPSKTDSSVLLVNSPQQRQNRYKCGECNVSTESNLSLMRHYQIVHKVDTKLKVLITKTSVDDNNSRNSTAAYQCKSECDVKLFDTKKCSDCTFEASSNYTLNIHYLQAHENICSECANCKILIPPWLVVKHSTECLGFYKCSFCSYKARIKQKFLLHIQLHTVHLKPIIKCKLCDFTSLHVIVRKHYSATHRENKCSFCSYTSKEMRQLKKHIQKQHSKRSSSENYFCEKCYFYSSAETVKIHYRKVHNICLPLQEIKEKFKISISEAMALKKKFNNSAAPNNNNFIKIYVCEKCSYETSIKKDLIDHKLLKCTE